MCLSRFLSDSVERQDKGDAGVAIIETMWTLLRETHTSEADMKKDHLEGTVPFEILRSSQR
ncbi:MAG TPA: hypothetical protein VMT62_16895 [Syntrophorhabdaceae bacterium]|nr:hypothetical protein [Syntrophorhabdaceae bacterium]